MDSGAYSELSRHGCWTVTPRAYGTDVVRIASEAGKLAWASIQDWICTPGVLRRTGLSLNEHQRRSVESLVYLRSHFDQVHWVPVLQGWSPRSYVQHVRMYEQVGLNLRRERAIGVGSMASRQGSSDLYDVFSNLAQEYKSLHGFGLSVNGLRRVHTFLASADSMVWSFVARRRKLKYEHCDRGHANCNNCIAYALYWRRSLLREIAL